MKLALPLILLVASSACYAAEQTFTKEYDACVQGADGGGPFERMACINAEIKRQGALLDTSYKAALQAIPAAKQPNLKEAQRTWLKFINQNCDFFHNPESGALPEEARSYCVMRMTADRKTELNEIEAAARGHG